MISNGTRNRLGALRGLPRNPADFYAVTDMATARRIGGVLWIFGAVIVALLIPVSPPDGRVGGIGWLVALATVAGCVAGAALLLRAPERVSPNRLLAMSYGAVGLGAAVTWAGGQAYSELFIIPVVYAAAVHPPRRVAVVMLVVFAAMAAPLAYDGWSGGLAAELVAKALLWSSLAAIALLFTATVRVQRMELREEGEQASALARRDPLTGLGNRRAFDELLQRLVASPRRSDRPLVLAVADIQGFKAVNDRHGHLEGDRFLRAVGEVLRKRLRAPDACFRWGGDEFAIVLPATDLESARVVVDRVAEAVGAAVAPRDEDRLRLKFGLAELEPGMSAADLLAAADLELMSAKAAERDHAPSAPS